MEAANATAARELRDGARRDVERLTASLHARHAADTDHLAHATNELNEILGTESAADLKARWLGEVVLELRRLVAGLRLEEVQREEAEMRELRTVREAELDAWEATPVLVELQDAKSVEKSVQHLVNQQEQKARPALVARDAAAAFLARALLQVMERAQAEQTAAEGQADQFEQQAREASKRAQAAVSDREQAAAEARNVRQTIDKIQLDLSVAVDDGVLDAPDVIYDAAAEAKRRSREAKTQLHEAHQRRPLLTKQRKDAESTLADRRRVSNTAATAAGASSDLLAAAIARTSTLAAQPRLAALLGADTVNLETDAETVAERLATAIGTADKHRARLEMAQAVDERVLAALGNGGLLPPNISVSATLHVLDGVGITAWAGWTYLARLPAPQREAIIGLHPQLVDGIVINNPKDLPRAEELLVDARLVPSTIVAVGTTATLLDRSSPPPSDVDFVVPPNPALYDERAAELERQRLTAAHEQRSGEIREFEQQATDDRNLAEQVRSWSTDFPPGELARLAEVNETAATRAAEALAAVAAAEQDRDVAASAEEALQLLIPQMVEDEEHARSLAVRLQDLATRAAGLRTLLAAERAALDEVSTAERNRDAAERRSNELLEFAKEQRGVAGDRRRTREASREEKARIPGVGDVTAAAPVPPEPLPELRGRYEAALELYRRVEVGDDLLISLRSAQETAAQVLRRWEAVAADARARAEELLHTSDGSDAASRVAATERVRYSLKTLGERIDAVVKRVGQLEEAYGSFTRQERSLEPYGKPRDIAHGEELIARADADGSKAREVLGQIQSSRSTLQHMVEQTKLTVAEFKAVVQSLASMAPAAPGDQAPAFALSIEEAMSKRDAVTEALTGANKLLEEATSKERIATDALAQYAVDPRFEDVKSPVRRQILAVNRDNMPEYAQHWETALRPRLRTLNDDLAQIAEHRANITSRLQGLVNAAIRTLRQAQRLSKLPAALGDWAGQEFLRIHFTESDQSALHERLGQVVDDTADAVRDDKQRQRIDGMAIVIKGVHAAMPKGITVEMLKPDTVLRNERVRVSQVHDVFSGGQHLTAAIILYCTMAALRANERGQANRPHAGVLFLDNPIGRASAGYLLDLQLEVAKALGVQLVYTTGLFDINALSVFPLIVRLRNDADLRAGLKYLSIDGEIRRALDDLDAPDAGDRVTATRVFVRPRQSVS